MFAQDSTERTVYRAVLILLEVVLVLVCSSALIRWVMTPPDPSKELASKEAKFKKENDAKFAAMLAEAKKDGDAGRYDVALATYRSAEHITSYVTDDQYDALKQGMEKVAADDGGSEASYQALTDAANYEGGYWLRKNEWDTAIARYVDAENYADHLTTSKRAALIDAQRGLMQAYLGKRAFSDSVEANLRLIDTIRSGGDPYIRELTGAYMDLAHTYSQEPDTTQTRNALMIAWRLADDRIAHFSGMPGERNQLHQAIQDKEVTLNWLVASYSNAGEVDHALATAQELYNFVGQQTAPFGRAMPYSRRDVANIALRVALDANRRDEANLWRARSNKGP